MAARTVLYDDMEDTENLAEGTYSLCDPEGHMYEIDLSHKNLTQLRAEQAKWLERARPVGRRVGVRNTAARRNGRSASSGSSGYTKEQLTAARKWLNTNGHPVSEFGKIPAADLEYYETHAGRPA